MKTILMMAVSVLMFNSTSFGQAMQSHDIVAHMDTIDQAASFLPSGDHLGRSGTLSVLPNCSVTVAPTNDEGGGLLAVISSTSVFDLLGSKSKSLASIAVYYRDTFTDDTAISNDQVIIGYRVQSPNEISKTLKIKKLSNSQALVTITESKNNMKINSTSCRVKVN